MKPTVMSLRTRLFILILTPLLLVSVLLGIWRYNVAQRTAQELFDRSLLAAALAISRDVGISEGDALSPRTRALVSDAGGGEIFYHVTGPGGIYVTGYAYPPSPAKKLDRDTPQYFVANYRGDRVRVLRLSELTTIDNLTGETVVTVWQRASDRHAFALTLARRTLAIMGALMAVLAFVVWFGVQLGLRPLRGLQDAIEQRSPDDLSRIKRPVQSEVSGIVETLNGLLKQVEDSIQAHQAFISDAAHQLRNPTAAMLSLAETLPDVHEPEQRLVREQELIASARATARLAESLLSLERLRYDGLRTPELIELNQVAERACSDAGPGILSRNIDFEFDATPESLPVIGDAVLLGEAMTNLIDNALRHGGPHLSRISVRTRRNDRAAHLIIEDDGCGLPLNKVEIAFRRFSQLESGDGSGLGLSIVEEILKSHGGGVTVNAVEQGTSILLSIPLAQTDGSAAAEERVA